MKVFVTGTTGFAGSHLVELLLSQGHEVFALVHHESSHQPLTVHARFHALAGDLLNLGLLMDAVIDARPDIIIHLAGQASASQSWQDPARTLAINTGGTANILQAALEVGRPRTLVVTSAQIYGPVGPDMLPITEDSIPKPSHPYGISKWAAGQLVALYWQKYKLPVVEARPFNHIGPRQAKGFVVPDFASQIAEIKFGNKSPVMTVGNLSVERDFTDVRDVVKAYWLLAEQGIPGEQYLICSGTAVPIRQLLDTLIELAEIDLAIVNDAELVRPSETHRLFGSYAKLKRDTGWIPTISLRQSLADALAEWEQKWVA